MPKIWSARLQTERKRKPSNSTIQRGSSTISLQRISASSVITQRDKSMRRGSSVASLLTEGSSYSTQRDSMTSMRRGSSQLSMQRESSMASMQWGSSQLLIPRQTSIASLRRGSSQLSVKGELPNASMRRGSLQFSMERSQAMHPPLKESVTLVSMV